jgi:hypothetical protein
MGYYISIGKMMVSGVRGFRSSSRAVDISFIVVSSGKIKIIIQENGR